MVRILGIDYGLKKVGIAVSDESIHLAFPFSVLENDKNLVKNIAKICRGNDVTKIVLGESLDYKGRPNVIMESIEEFKRLLEEKITLPVVFENEVLTTKQALHLQGHHEKIDASAAALILQSYIDRNF